MKEVKIGEITKIRTGKLDASAAGPEDCRGGQSGA